MRLKVHPLFVALAVILIACGQALAGFWTFVAVTLHELGHAFAARARGYVVNSLTVLPFGAVMSSTENFDRTSSVLIGLAGPLVNGLLALITLGLWWLFPAAYEFTRLFLYANVSLFAFNLLPVYPLDGSRVVLGLAKNRLRAVKGLKVAGIVVSFLMFGLFIASAFFKINFSLGIVAVFLFYGAAFSVNEECYVSVFSVSGKDYGGGVEKRCVKINGSVPIARLFRFVSPNCETGFILVGEGGGYLANLTETDLHRLAVNNKLSSPVWDAYVKGLQNPSNEGQRL